jgi:pyridoxamine 5'-phosphate oxidase
MSDPFVLFSKWLEAAKAHPAITEPTAMCLATADGNAMPSARIVLLKWHDARGFVFYTNFESRKSAEIKTNPHVALCFWWMALERQVRIEGEIVPVSDAEADAYYASRHRESRIGAWSSRQSQPLGSREELVAAVEANEARFEGKDVPRPPFWSGWRVVPRVIEFWQQSEFRLHDRDVYTRNASGGWDIGKLYP